MTDILEKINQTKRQEIKHDKYCCSLNEIKARAYDTGNVRPFLQAIKNKHAKQEAAVIAEIKKASPSQGLIRKNFDPQAIARDYEKAGAVCLSILTDQYYFQGSLDYLKEARAAVSLPVLRKDFIIDEYQIYQARAWQADAILLIVASLSQNQLQDFEGIAHELGMTVLVELHEKQEISKCIHLHSPLFGVNNRNLRTFEVDLEQTAKLLPLLENKIIVAESGIHSRADIIKMQGINVNTFLVGESLMRQDNVELALRALLQEK